MENFIVNVMEEQSIKKKYTSNPQCAEARLVITKHIKVIYVKKDLAIDQEEFAIMHELGHYFCEYVPGFFCPNQTECSRCELIASFFALIVLFIGLKKYRHHFIMYCGGGNHGC